MPSTHAPVELLAALGRLREQVDQAALAMDTPGVEAHRAQRARMLDQLVDYILPRLVQLDAPMLAVVGGSTGAGKSTLVNTLVGERVSESGVLRPTTRSPVLIHHPDDAEWFGPDRLLPELPRDGTYGLRVVANAGVPAGLALLDAPDIDSIDDRNRALAAQLLDAADLWLFVTSAARYADSVPWEYLNAAVERDASVAVVLDRTVPDAVAEVRRHLARIMTSRGMSDSPLFTLPESALDREGLLPAEAVAGITRWLQDLAQNPAARETVIRRTLDGAVRQVVFDSHDLADAIEVQLEASSLLHSEAEETYGDAVDELIAVLGDGTLFSGHVAARWQDFIGTGDAVTAEDDRGGRQRSRSLGIAEALGSAVAATIAERAEAAAEQTASAWFETSYGRALIENADLALDRASAGLEQQAQGIAEQWFADIQDLVRERGSDRRMTTNYLALGVHGLAVALAVTVVHRDAADAELVEVASRLVASVFGDDVAVELATVVADDLVDRIRPVFDAELRRYLDRVESPEQIALRQASLRDAARRTDNARHLDHLDREETS